MPFYLNRKHIYCRVFPRPYDKLIYYISETVETRYWSHKQHKVLAAHPRAMLINTLMRKIQDIIDHETTAHKISGIPLTSLRLRHILDTALYGNQQQEQHTQITLQQYTAQYIHSRSASIRASTITAYTSKMKRLFEIFPHLDFHHITNTWRHIAYETLSATYAHNNVCKILSVLRTILHAAIQEGITDIIIPDKLVPQTKATDHIFLSKDIINTLFTHKYSQPHLTNAVRLWGVLYYTGQRVSDKRALIDGEHIIAGDTHIIRFRQTKTTNRVALPITPALADIIERPPTMISDQKLNKYIKIAAAEAGIPDAEQITAHTARRSCATNLALDGFPLHMIMDITGHKTIKQLMEYIGYSDIQAAIKVSQHSVYQQMHRYAI